MSGDAFMRRAIALSREGVHYANDRADAARIGFDDEALYRELTLPVGARAIPMVRRLPDEARAAFEAWARDPSRVRY